ncbi:LLM class flavin-dependent oxidoreductase [Propionibacteriaceae bacterium Y1685]|uniref:LLM class flavin-dependent oxidoreductase n=1 Tax=Microlunatus sp. Y1700 TaxID=3418487 RepID=UPI003B7F3BA9
MASLRLSVLDLVPVRTGQTTADAVKASIRLARVADENGLHRLWIAEHHNMPAVAATNPPVLISLLAGATQRLRIGSGGVMLPNHAPLVVAEQFALLEAAYPGRIDLGIGRAPGSDPVTNHVLRHGGPVNAEEAVAQFEGNVENLIMMMDPGGVGVAVQGREYGLRATPAAVSSPPVWLLGSSDYSARLAAKTGLPYVFAHHFAGRGTAEALALYRDGFTPAAPGDQPQTFLTVNAVVADTAEEAEALALPYQQQMLALRSGQPMEPIRLVEEAEEVSVPDAQRPLLDSMRESWVIGDPASAAAQLTELAERFDVDEVMVHPVAGARRGTDPAVTPTRERTLQLLARELLNAG